MAIDKGKEKNKKTMSNNQWVGASSVGSSKDYRNKTATNNEWVSTHKMVDNES